LAAQSEREKGRAALEDFGQDLFPQMVKAGRAFGFLHDAYWRDVGTVEAYHAAHMDLLESTPSLNPQDQNWPILTRALPNLPARVGMNAKVENSLLAPGCEIGGEVLNSIIAPRAKIEVGAKIENSVVLPGAVVKEGAKVLNAIVLPDARVKGAHGAKDKVVLVGARSDKA